MNWHGWPGALAGSLVIFSTIVWAWVAIAGTVRWARPHLEAWRAGRRLIRAAGSAEGAAAWTETLEAMGRIAGAIAAGECDPRRGVGAKADGTLH